MKRLLVISLFASVFLGPSKAEDSPLVVRLSSGREVIGQLEEFDPDSGIVMRRADNGGTLTLVWEQIRPEDVETIRRSHGYVDDEVAPVTIPASRITFTNGKTQIGVILENKENSILLKAKGNEVEIPRSRVVSIDVERVDALSVFSSDELYQQHVSDRLPETALQHFDVGVFCESIERLDLALEHYNKAQEIDPSIRANEILGKIQLCQLKLESKDQTDRLNEIKTLTFRREFARAQELAATFETDFPDVNPQLTGEAKQLGIAALRAQKKYLTSRLSSDFIRTLDDIVRKTVRNPELNLNSQLTYMRDQVAEDIFETLAAKYDVERSFVDELWVDRVIKKPLTRQYGDGTFILPDPLAEPEESTSKKETAKKDENKPETLNDRINEIISNREKGRRRGSRGSRKGVVADVGLTPDEWYAQADTNHRRYFLMAYFGENTEWLQVHRVSFRPCSLCNGTGRIETVSSEKGRVTEYCPRCKGLKVDRIVDIK